MPSKEITELRAIVEELRAWKERQEQAQTERINEMHAAIVDIFVSRHAVTTEILTIVKLLENEATTNYITSQKKA